MSTAQEQVKKAIEAAGWIDTIVQPLPYASGYRGLGYDGKAQDWQIIADFTPDGRIVQFEALNEPGTQYQRTTGPLPWSKTVPTPEEAAAVFEAQQSA
jgi:hypothetical protein